MLYVTMDMKKGQMASETAKALDLIRKGAVPAHAARKAGVHPCTIYRALANIRRANKRDGQQ